MFLLADPARENRALAAVEPEHIGGSRYRRCRLRCARRKSDLGDRGIVTGGNDPGVVPDKDGSFEALIHAYLWMVALSPVEMTPSLCVTATERVPIA